jgi:GH43 family beta-xylosidase
MLTVDIGGANIFDKYTYAGQLFNEWSIDGTVLRFPDKNYFVYSCQRTGLQSLCIAPMNSPTSVGAAKTLSQPTLSWEKIGEFPVNEGPAALYHGGKTFLTYSASYCWTSSYQLGLLTYKSGDPTNSASWTKSGPVFSSANGNYGTGHNGYVCYDLEFG